MKIMDFDSFLYEMDNDYEVVNMIVSEFITSLNLQVLQINSLLKEKDYSVISREAHSIKGGARNVMSPLLEDAALLLEESAKSEDDISILKNLEKLKDGVDKFKAFVGEHMPMPIAESLS